MDIKINNKNREKLCYKKISILMPVLNTRQFLEERFESIFNQTYQNWELVLVDGYSDDGSWEFIQRVARGKDNVSIYQYPRNGIYDAINKCIKLSSGEYIYIAISDDTMSIDCLEKMAETLDSNNDCDICHCCLRIIDQNGSLHTNKNWNYYYAQQFYKEFNNKLHVRKAPLDGLLHLGLGTVYTSLTQLLVRKKIFENLGLFRDDWGSVSDFEWGMRVSLAFNTVHIPEYLATWRIHDTQATQNQNTSEIKIKIKEMSCEALKTVKEYNFKLFNQIDLNKLQLNINKEIYYYKVMEKKHMKVKLYNFCINLFSHPIFSCQLLCHYFMKLLGLKKTHFINRMQFVNKIFSIFKIDKNNNIFLLSNKSFHEKN